MPIAWTGFGSRPPQQKSAFRCLLMIVGRWIHHSSTKLNTIANSTIQSDKPVSIDSFSWFQSGRRIGSRSQPVQVHMPSSWRSVLVAVQYLATAMRNSIGPFSICGLSSCLISSLEFYCDLLRWELVAGALLLCPELQSLFLTKEKSSQHCSLKLGSKLMTASFEWIQMVSVQKPNRKLFSTCPRAYAKQLAQCFYGSAVCSNSHNKFQWPIQ